MNHVRASRVVLDPGRGGEPAGEAAFAELAKLGVKVVVSVDGTRPDVAAARKHGIRFVHIPIGYGGVPAEAGQALARVVRETARTGEPVHFHCHHGKHRGPAAAAVAGDAARAADRLQALDQSCKRCHTAYRD